MSLIYLLTPDLAVLMIKTKYPTTFLVLPSYAMEAKIIAKLIADTPTLKPMPSFLIAQDDEFGKDGVKGFAVSRTQIC
jgi:branched-chain amino acid transport system substrate-binding protein